MDSGLPEEIHYWITSTSKHDCFFNVGPEDGPKERIGAIKVLLFAHSEVLRKMLDESPLAETGDIPVIDSDPDTFTNFLKCLYGGTGFIVRSVSYEQCLGVLYLCEKYLALNIKDKISSLLIQLYQPLTINEVLKTLSTPACLTTPDNCLVKAVQKVIQNRTEEIINHKSFSDLDLYAVTFITKQQQLSTTETNLWKAVFRWAQKKVDPGDPKAVRSCLKDIIKQIRFCSMKASDFCELVATTKVLTQDEVFEICNAIGAKTVPNLRGLSCKIEDRSVKQTQELTFTYVLNNIKQFAGEIESPKYKLGDFYWNIFLGKEGTNQLSIYLCRSSEGRKSSWKCSAKFEFTLVNHKGRHNWTKSSTFKEFTKTSTYWGYDEFYAPLCDLVNIKKGFIKNNSVVIVTRVELKSGD